MSEITLKTQKMLWGRSAGRCSMPKCRIQLHVDSTEPGEAALIGENCHIVSEANDGPRGLSALIGEQRRQFDNLILLCRNHHKMVDSQVDEYTVAKLHDLKNAHIKWVESLDNFDAKKLADDEFYAALVDEWVERCPLKNWSDLSLWILSHGQPSLPIMLSNQLDQLRKWLLNRVWPGRYEKLEQSFQNFLMVLSDFHETFLMHAEPPDPASGRLQTTKFYRIGQVDSERYQQLAKQYRDHVTLVGNLMCELTRAANLVCDEVREALYGNFMVSEGYLLIETGLEMDLRSTAAIALYRPDERRTYPIYPGLDKFAAGVCFERDPHYPKRDG